MNGSKYPHVGATYISGKVKWPVAKLKKNDSDSLIRRANAEYNRICDENGDI